MLLRQCPGQAGGAGPGTTEQTIKLTVLTLVAICSACREAADWPDMLLMDSAEWPLFVDKNMTQHVLQMRALLATLQEQVCHGCLPGPLIEFKPVPGITTVMLFIATP